MSLPNNPGFDRIRNVLAIIFALIAITGFWALYQRETKSITSFEECAAAGNPVMESYPEVCLTKDGKRFVRDIETTN